MVSMTLRMYAPFCLMSIMFQELALTIDAAHANGRTPIKMTPPYDGLSNGHILGLIVLGAFL